MGCPIFVLGGLSLTNESIAALHIILAVLGRSSKCIGVLRTCKIFVSRSLSCSVALFVLEDKKVACENPGKKN